MLVDSCADVVKQETERLNMEIEELHAKIRLHNQTKDAWDTILRNAGSGSHDAYMDFANSEAKRINGEIEAVQEEISRHIQIKDAWDTVERNAAGSKSRIYQSVIYSKGEDVQWHLQRLDGEIEALQGEVRLRNETKDAWDAILRNAGSKSQAAYMDFANSEAKRINGEIEAVQDMIRRHTETRAAWDTIRRNAVGETHIYQGATYAKGWDGQWHLQKTLAGESIVKDGINRTDTADPKVNAAPQTLLNVPERTIRSSPKRISIPMRGKQPLFQSLGLL
jgi:hypothetical protein